MKSRIFRLSMNATVAMAVAFCVYGCKGKLATTRGFDISEHPFQVIDSMFIVQTDKGTMQLRSEAPRVERYRNDSLEYELFPDGFAAYGYSENGELETEIKGDHAKHTKPRGGDEVWMAYGNVSVKNLVKHETMETDTLYWDRNEEKIYTDCYVRLYSPSGFMQGYGMESDQRARSSVIKRPFNSYGIMDNDSTAVEVDSVNFIGPFPVNI